MSLTQFPRGGNKYNQSPQSSEDHRGQMTIEDHIILGENVIESDTLDITVRAPAIYSWGRSDTNTLLQSPNDTPSANGIQALTFANKRTIIQVIKVQHL